MEFYGLFSVGHTFIPIQDAVINNIEFTILRELYLLALGGYIPHIFFRGEKKKKGKKEVSALSLPSRRVLCRLGLGSQELDRDTCLCPAVLLVSGHLDLYTIF
jgi:hypothetical protein